jgi:5'-3' exonuclease
VTTTLLVDADIVAFKFAAKAERKTPFGVAVDELDTVTPKMDEYLRDYMQDLDATGAIICLSCPSSEGWRKDILPSYKDNRADVYRPTLLGDLKVHLAVTWPSYRKPALEADDVMGILSTMDGLPRNFLQAYPELASTTRKVIFSEDKDMKTIPGWLFNPAKDSKPRLVSEGEADYWHLYQSLVGDSTDGYTGLPKCGPVAANKALLCQTILEPLGLQEMWEATLALYKSKGLALEDALVQARVARICRASDYDFNKQRVIPWNPPQPSTPATAPSASTGSSSRKASPAPTRSAPKATR